MLRSMGRGFLFFLLTLWIVVLPRLPALASAQTARPVVMLAPGHGLNVVTSISVDVMSAEEISARIVHEDIINQPGKIL